MSNETMNATPQQEKCSKATLPEWAVPIARACRVVTPFLIIAGVLLLVAILAAVGIVRAKPVDLSWALTLIGLAIFLLILGFLALLISKPISIVPGWIVFLLGVGLYFSPLPLLTLAKKIGIPDTSILAKGVDTRDVVNVLAGKLPSFSIFLLIIAFISLVINYIILFREREEHRRKVRFQYMDPTVKHIDKPSMVPKCWQMSRCRPSVRMTCPNYIDHHTCWKRRSGCFCDRELANFLIGSVGRGEAQEVMDMQKRTGMQQSVSKMRGHMTEKGKRPSWKTQKFRCHNCPIYVEHQEYKYRHFSWMSFLVTGGIIAVCWPLFDQGYNKGATYLTRLLEHQSIKVLGIAKPPELANSSFEYVLYAVLFLLLWGYVIEFMDKFFLEWKM